MHLFSSSIHSLTTFSWIASLSLMPGQAHTGHRKGVGSVPSAPLVPTAWRKLCLPPALPWSKVLTALSGAFSCAPENMCKLQIFFKDLSHSQNCVVSHKKRKRHISSKDWLPFPIIFQVLFQPWSPRTSQWNRIRLFYFNEGQRAHFSLSSSKAGTSTCEWFPACEEASHEPRFNRIGTERNWETFWCSHCIQVRASICSCKMLSTSWCSLQELKTLSTTQGWDQKACCCADGS